MNVRIVDEVPSLKEKFPSSGKTFEEVSQNLLPLADFRAAVNGRDSFFRLQDSIVELPERSLESHGSCIGQFVIVFRRLDLVANRSLYCKLSQTLRDLLKATSSSDALFAKLCVTPAAAEDARASELSLILQLEAIGSTPEPAEFRWSFGLRHVQEVIISASRLWREQLANLDL
jgi:hypothetical protein